MSLVEGNEMIEISETDLADVTSAIEKWQHFPASTISHHNAECCQIAREWILSMDYSQLNAGHTLTGPRWLRLKYKWGPSRWPIHWCEAAGQKTLDCGALAALSQEIFAARGVRCYPAQFIQQYTEQSARHWHKKWAEDESSAHWIKEDLIYHEGCAVAVRDNEIKIWDPTASWWMNPKQFGGYGGVLVVRIFDPRSSSPTGFNWGTHRIVANQWQKIERARGEFS